MPSKAPDAGLSDKIRQGIRESGLTLFKLAEEAGIDRGQLSRFQAGKRSMTLDTADKVCGVLGYKLIETKRRASKR